jgi:hypothetical protein
MVPAGALSPERRSSREFVASRHAEPSGRPSREHRLSRSRATYWASEIGRAAPSSDTTANAGSPRQTQIASASSRHCWRQRSGFTRGAAMRRFLSEPSSMATPDVPPKTPSPPILPAGVSDRAHGVSSRNAGGPRRKAAPIVPTIKRAAHQTARPIHRRRRAETTWSRVLMGFDGRPEATGGPPAPARRPDGSLSSVTLPLGCTIAQSDRRRCLGLRHG